MQWKSFAARLRALNEPIYHFYRRHVCTCCWSSTHTHRNNYYHIGRAPSSSLHLLCSTADTNFSPIPNFIGKLSLSAQPSENFVLEFSNSIMRFRSFSFHALRSARRNQTLNSRRGKHLPVGSYFSAQSWYGVWRQSRRLMACKKDFKMDSLN